MKSLKNSQSSRDITEGFNEFSILSVGEQDKVVAGMFRSNKRKSPKESPYDFQKRNPNYPTSSIIFPTIAQGSINSKCEMIIEI